MTDCLVKCYKDYEIRYEEHMDSWVAYQENKRVLSGEQLSSVIAKLDKLDKSTFVRIPVLRVPNPYSSGWEGVITSVSEDDNRPWVSWKGGRREKAYSSSDLYMDTAANRTILTQWKALDAERQALAKRQEILVKTLEHFTLPKEK